jgi:hypothetical protein
MTTDEILQDILRRLNGRHYGAMRGTVTDNVDPEGRHRVKVLVHALDIETGWAYPLTLGGGSKDRGMHIVPEVGADVAVWFDR